MANESGYGKSSYKRNWKKWVVIYAAIAVVIYAIIYFLFFRPY